MSELDMIPDKVFLIEELWFDPFENRNAHGYSPHGFVRSKGEADCFVAFHGSLPKSACWSFLQDMPKYRYTEIQDLNP